MQHIIIGAPGQGDAILRVFLPGTGSYPLQYSCILRAMARSARGAPVVGLSYAFLPLSDAARNAACATAPRSETPTCLERQHQDALYGGQREPDLWPMTAEDDSIEGRLTRLLQRLASTYPDEGWGAYLTPHTDRLSAAHRQTAGRNGRLVDGPRWDRIWIGGHSQGGGHAAYLAATQSLAGATLLSAPQDACIDCSAQTTLWLDAAPWATRGPIHAFAHANETAVATIRSNWLRMAGSVGYWAARSAPRTPAQAPGQPADIGLGLMGWMDERNGVPALGRQTSAHAHAPWLSSLLPSTLLLCHGKPMHCSTAKDVTTPVAAADAQSEQVLALYELAVWPALWGLDDASLSSQANTSSDALAPEADTPSAALLVGAGAAAALASVLLLVALAGFVCRLCKRLPSSGKPVVRSVTRQASALPAEVSVSQSATAEVAVEVY